MDSNHDGVVTMEEFISACLGESELTQLLALKAVEIFVDNQNQVMNFIDSKIDANDNKICGFIVD